MNKQRLIEQLEERLRRLQELARESRGTPSADYDAGRVDGMIEALEIITNADHRTTIAGPL